MRRFDLRGKVGIVTGGNGGIGSGIARGLLEGGASVVIAGRNEDKTTVMVKELGAVGPPVSAFTMDVTDESQCQAVVRETVARHGRLDILVNNAGVGSGGKLPQELTLADWHRVMDANVTSAFMLSQAAYPEMRRALEDPCVAIVAGGVRSPTAPRCDARFRPAAGSTNQRGRR